MKLGLNLIQHKSFHWECRVVSQKLQRPKTLKIANITIQKSFPKKLSTGTKAVKFTAPAAHLG